MQSVSGFSTIVRRLNQTPKAKYVPGHFSNLELKGDKYGLFTCSRIICTDSKLQRAFLQTNDSHISRKEPNFLAVLTLNDPLKVCDHNIKSAVPTSLQSLEELLWTKEFKEALSRSSFSYDVTLLQNYPGCFLVSSAYHYSFEDVYQSHYRKLTFSSSNQICSSSSNQSNKHLETGKATEEQLKQVIDRLTVSLLNFFETSHDFSVYHKNIIFENNIKGVTIKGLPAYMQAMTLLKFYGYIQFSKVGVEILKITHHTDDGSIRVRWRVKGLPRHKLLLQMLKLKSLNVSQLLKEESEWLDGFSVFLVGSDGLIYKHICDKITPDENSAVPKQGDLKSRLLGLFQLGPRGPAAGSLQALLPYYSLSKKLT